MAYYLNAGALPAAIHADGATDNQFDPKAASALLQMVLLKDDFRQSGAESVGAAIVDTSVEALTALLKAG